MRLAFLILLIVNVLTFLAIRHAEHQPGVEAQIALLQINPEKVKVVKLDDSNPAAPTPQPALPTPAAPTPQPTQAAQSACFDWGEFIQQDVANATTLLASLGLSDRVTQRETGDLLYWVYIPSLKTKADADKKAAEVKDLKVGDYSEMPDGDAWIVSLGAFKTEDNANQRLAQAKQQGVRSVIVSRRGPHNVIFTLRDPGDTALAQLAAFKTSDGNSVPPQSVSCLTTTQQ